MDIKLIAVDLDGTVLKDDKSISKRTIDTLLECKEKGIIICVATSRSNRAASKYIERIQPDIMISCGGALAMRDDDILYEKALDIDTSDRLLMTMAAKYSIADITVDAADGFYISRVWEDIDSDYNHGKVFDFSKPFDHPTYKIVAEIEDERLAFKLKSDFPECDFLKFVNEDWYRFAHIDATKESALGQVCAKLNIPTKEVMSFGDDYNDIGMLNLAGVGVVMGNATDEIKMHGSHVCDTNNNDGIAKFIIKNLFNI